MVDRIATPSRPAAGPPRTSQPAPPVLPLSSLRTWIEPLEKFIGDHPGASLASALIVGVAVAWWIKRR